MALPLCDIRIITQLYPYSMVDLQDQYPGWKTCLFTVIDLKVKAHIAQVDFFHTLLKSP